MKTMMKQISPSPLTWLRAAIAVMVVCLMLPVAVAHADPLDDARAAGLLGERPDGYVDAVAPNPSPDIVSLKEQINAQRRKIYQQLAGEKGVPAEEVAALAAEKTISQKLKPGMYYMNASGQWVQK
jgi:uncharacterized protein YdbL (DUF1318 family)